MAALDWMVFSDAQAITTSGTTNSTSVLDTEFADSNLGGGTPLWVWCRVNTSFSPCTGTTATFDAAILTCATSGGTYEQIGQGFAFSNGEITKGLDLLTVPLPVRHKRYLKMAYTTTTGSGWIAGKIDSFLTLNAPRK